MPAAKKSKMTKTQYQAEMAKHQKLIDKHNTALNGPNGLHNKIHLDATNAVYRHYKDNNIKRISPKHSDLEKEFQAHKDYPKYKKHLDALTKARKAADKTYEQYHGKKFNDTEYRDTRSSMLIAKMQVIAGDKPTLSRKYHKTMMRFHRREGNHHLSIENAMMANANKCRNKPGDYTAEGEGYKACAEDHAKMVQRHANKYQSHKNAMRAIPAGRKKGSK
jgi:hypothetical protein